MITLLLKAGLFVSGLLLIVAGLYQHAVRYSDANYLAAIVDKQQRAEELRSQPRLLLTGGSGTAFAIDSQLLEDSLHRPVVNLAMHAGLGLPFMLRQVQKLARPGDVVLLTPEYFLGTGDDYTQFYTSEFYAPAVTFMTFDGPLNYLVRRIAYCLKRVQISLFLGIDDQRNASITDTTSVYFRAGFSRQGDLISPLNNKRPATFSPIQIVPRDYAAEIAMLNETVAYLSRHNVATILAYPALAESQFKANQLAIRAYVGRLKQVRTVRVLGSPDQTMYPDSCFFDTPYHLHGISRRAHSRLLVSQLKGFIQPVAEPLPVAALR